jgi:hypothetical protein
MNTKEFIINQYISNKYKDLYISVINGDFNGLKKACKTFSIYLTAEQNN